MCCGSAELRAVSRSTSPAGDLHCTDVIVRLVFLLLLSMAMVIAGGCANAASLDAQAQLLELEAEDEMITEVVVVDANVASPAPPLVQGTEADHTSPVQGGVFRPPRGALVRIA